MPHTCLCAGVQKATRTKTQKAGVCTERLLPLLLHPAAQCDWTWPLPVKRTPRAAPPGKDKRAESQPEERSTLASLCFDLQYQ